MQTPKPRWAALRLRLLSGAKLSFIVIASGAAGLVLFIVVVLAFALHVRPAPQIGYQAAALTTLTNKIKALQTDPSEEPRTLHVSEAELNALIQERLEASRQATEKQSSLASANRNTGQAEVTDVRLKLNGDRVSVYVRLKLPPGKSMSVDIEGQLRSVNGFINFVPTSGNVGSIPLPRSALVEILRQIEDSPKGREAMRLPATLSNMQVENGELVVAYK